MRVHFHLQDMIIIGIYIRYGRLWIISTIAVAEPLDDSSSFYGRRATVQNANGNERFVSVYIDTLKTEPKQYNI